MRPTEVIRGDEYLGGPDLARVRKNTVHTLGFTGSGVNSEMRALRSYLDQISKYKPHAKVEPRRE
jgi:hypothetical protein